MRKKLLLCIIAVIIFTTSFNVKAEESEETEYKSTVQVNYGYYFSDGSMDVFCSAPAVVINSNTLVTYDMTRNDYSQQIQDRAEGYNTIGIKTEDIQPNLSLAVYTGEGEYIPVTEKIAYETPVGYFLILKTEEKLENPITFSPGTPKNDEHLYATGFSKQEMDGSHFIKKDSILKQNMKLISKEEGIIRFSVDSSEVFSGSALINEYNEMYGLVISTDGGGVAISSQVIEQVLNENSLIYTTGSAISPIDKSELHSVTDAAIEIDTVKTEYTKESLDDFNEKIDHAADVINNPNATQEEIDKATEELKISMENLTPAPKKSSMGWIMWTIIIAVILIFICAIAILFLKNPDMLYKLLGVKKKETGIGRVTANYIDNNTVIDGLEDINDSAAGVTPKMQRTGSFENQKNFQGGYIYEDRRDAPVNQTGTAVPDTSVLSIDMASNNVIKDVPYIIRVSTGERILINRNQFTIGRDYNVDYRIPENISISKCHCTFMSVADQWYIIDNKSSNKTLVNGTEIKPNESVPIYDKTEIVLANEKLIFRFIKDGEQAESYVSDTGILNTNTVNNQTMNNYQNTAQYGYQPQQYSEQQTEYDQTVMQQDTENKESYQYAWQKNLQTDRTPSETELNNDTDDDPDTNVLTAYQMPDGMRVPYLIIDNKKIKITHVPFSLGRSKKATYKYTNNNQVSREHVIITKENGQYYIKDNSSSNGTLLNGEPLDPQDEYLLNNGDKITIINDTIEFHV